MDLSNKKAVALMCFVHISEVEKAGLRTLNDNQSVWL